MTVKKRTAILSYLFVNIPLFVGGNFLLYFLGKMEESIRNFQITDYLWFNLVGIIGVFIGAILMQWIFKKKDDVPIGDERTIIHLKNYTVILLYGILFISGLLLLTLYFFGVQTIEIGWLFAYLAIIFILTIFGALAIILLK